ncbi:hypothetical protein [Duganella sp. S19_KUP01_CR8]|uniref:hypothetical protein n=1 Tax=Duganella sp. S19_KUP01_CR8 TaxID=3025502 RepID=UPI002FCD847C
MKNPAGKLVLLAFIGAVAAHEAGAVALYWTKTPVKSGSVKTCLGFASDAMRGTGMQGIRVSSMEVAGSRGNAYVAITCVNTAPRATAVVMVAGNELGETRQLSEELQRKIAGITLIDDSQ